MRGRIVVKEVGGWGEVSCRGTERSRENLCVWIVKIVLILRTKKREFIRVSARKFNSLAS